MNELLAEDYQVPVELFDTVFDVSNTCGTLVALCRKCLVSIVAKYTGKAALDTQNAIVIWNADINVATINCGPAFMSGNLQASESTGIDWPKLTCTVFSGIILRSVVFWSSVVMLLTRHAVPKSIKKLLFSDRCWFIMYFDYSCEGNERDVAPWLGS